LERRKFTRIIFSTPAELRQDKQIWSTKLLDLSFKGALLEKPDRFDGDLAQTFLLTFGLEGLPNNIILQGHITHEEQGHLGLHCELMDIDSATQLRRLIELNVGDTELLNRELANLTVPSQREHEPEQH